VVNALALILFVIWFLVIFVLRSVVQKRATGDSGIRPGAFAAGATRVERVASLLLMVAFIGGLAAPIAAIAGLDRLWSHQPLRLAGLALAVLGIGLTYAAQVGMGTEWRIGIDRAETTGLVTSGVFSLVRNPIFTAMIITTLGFVAMVPNLIAVAAVICLVIAIELQVRHVEEPHLARLHGPAYTAYTAGVGRFVPAIGRSIAGDHR